MSSQDNNSTCQLRDGACSEEALYHCTICKGKFCFQHLCVHLKQAQSLPLPECEDIESTDSELKAMSDMEVRSRRNRLFQELKRVQAELDRRVIFAADYFVDDHHIRPALNYGHPFYADPKEDKNKARADKELAKKQKAQQVLQDSLKILREAIVSGKVTKAELAAKFAKKG